MLSSIIKEKIEKRYGCPIKYPKDCDGLAVNISTCTNSPISGSTIKRLFGFVRGTREPHAYTLDVIAEYPKDK